MSDLDKEELIATRKLHGLDDDLFKEERKIEVGEYVRLARNQGINKIIDKEDDRYILESEIGDSYGDITCFLYEFELKDEITKHSKQLIDLIENKDILKIKIHKEIIFFGIDENTSDIKYKELIENIENGEYELLEILTHEQFETNCYKAGGENE